MKQKIIAFLEVGGPVVWILMVFSVVALTIVLLKLWQFAALRAESTKRAELALAQWRAGAADKSLALLNEKRPIDALVSYTMRAMLTAEANVEVIREEAERRAMNRLSQLRAYLRPLEIIATLSPLLGLLGTVLGMITAFQQMEGAGNQVDPSVLSGGIWQALLTTAVGLAVAIPVVTLHSWLERKVERIAHNMNDMVTQVFTVKAVNLVSSQAHHTVSKRDAETGSDKDKALHAA
ncbi:MotA/TolQ/ExbB proton channel family protein [Marinomonas vulgaris]|uniref:MotA/TolQ/ExbB proton channel family protein n=1 Tax=Marinomonas vulgaris TaxID=2823372 RepID=UPI002E27B8F8|nr:MotA/TolQ/ExbB proton channel family protein [Marinomonas vulgaris]